MGNVLDPSKQQQVVALGRLGWSLRRIEQATGVRRETISGYTAFVHVPIPGRQPYRKSRTFPNRAMAKGWGDAEVRRVLDELANGRPGQQPRAVPTLAEFAPRFIEEHVRANRHKASGEADKQSILRNHLLPAFGARPLDRIDTASVQRLKADLATRSPKTVENITSVLRKILKVAVEWDVLDAMPCTVKRTKFGKKTAAFYDFGEFDRAVATAAQISRDALLIVLLGGEAGLRLGEMRALDWTDIKWDANQVLVERSIWRGVMDSTKGMRYRAIPLTDRLRRTLLAHRRATGPVFPGRGPSGRLTHNEMRNRLRPMARRAGVRHGGHIRRHTFCSHLAMKGATAKEIQALAGHDHLSTTER